MKINKREEVWKVLNGEKTLIVPTIAEGFMDVTVHEKLGFKAPDDPIKLVSLLILWLIIGGSMAPQENKNGGWYGIQEHSRSFGGFD